MMEKIQNLGRFLSRMVMPNISAFIAWGILTTIFHSDGWFPNSELEQLIGPIIIYAIPLLIAYSGGKAIYGTRGGVIGVIGTMGLIAGSDIPMFIGAMLMGPLGAYILKKMDLAIKDHIPTGFEMLVTNFSAGFLGVLLTIVAYKAVGPLIAILNEVLKSGVTLVLDRSLLFLASIFIEPGKVLFLNNAINHGVLSPLGIQDALANGSSIFFLLETNPGPGLGILLAYWFYSKGTARDNAPSAMIIHFFGGIHEIYFPFVVMRPALFGAVIVGGMSGVFSFQLLGAGLRATPSPGSIFALMAMAPKSELIAVVIGVVISTAITFILACLILKRSPIVEIEDEFEVSENYTALFKGRADDFRISKITFACDAGMGSSALGASLLTRIIKQNQMTLPVVNVSIDAIPSDSDLVITYSDLIGRAKKQAPNAIHVGIKDFLNKEAYEQLIEAIKAYCIITEVNMEKSKPSEILMKTNIILNRATVSMEEAIKHAGELLYNSGYVGEAYIEGMLAREEKFSTYIGNNVAIPHGENSVKDCIMESGIVVVQYPNGVSFGDGKLAKLVIGIAGKGNEHIQLLANIAEAIEDESILEKMLTTNNPDYIYELFSSEGMM
ncbi:PTS mannitol transporter subunit IICBA [Fusibacter bizertensis]